MLVAFININLVLHNHKSNGVSCPFHKWRRWNPPGAKTPAIRILVPAPIERPRIWIREIDFLILLLSFETSNLPRIPYETSFSFVRNDTTRLFDVLTGQLFLFPHHLPCNLNFPSPSFASRKQRFPIFRSMRVASFQDRRIIITIILEFVDQSNFKVKEMKTWRGEYFHIWRRKTREKEINRGRYLFTRYFFFFFRKRRKKERKRRRSKRRGKRSRRRKSA